MKVISSLIQSKILIADRVILYNVSPGTRSIFSCASFVLESICYRTTAKRLINESNTTGRLKKN